MCRGLSHEFGVVRLYRTFSNCIFTWGTRCVCTYTLVPGGSTTANLFSKHFSTKKARRVEVFRMSSGWFDYTEPHLHRGNKVCRVPMLYFRVVQPQRTSSNLLEPLQCGCVEVFYMSSGWFEYTEPSRSAF